METKLLISPQELTSLLAEETSQIAIIDTRSSEEYVKSHLPGAINIRELFTYLLENSQPDGLKKLSDHFSELLSKAGISGAEN